MSAKYDRTGRQVRACERAMRRGEVPGIEKRLSFKDVTLPLLIGTALFIIVGVLIDPSSMFTIR